MGSWGRYQSAGGRKGAAMAIPKRFAFRRRRALFHRMDRSKTIAIKSGTAPRTAIVATVRSCQRHVVERRWKPIMVSMVRLAPRGNAITTESGNQDHLRASSWSAFPDSLGPPCLTFLRCRITPADSFSRSSGRATQQKDELTLHAYHLAPVGQSGEVGAVSSLKLFPRWLAERGLAGRGGRYPLPHVSCTMMPVGQSTPCSRLV